MNVALILAGGSGQRMHQDIPKQFIPIHDKPVIIYTLEAFQNHEKIDAIEVVCLDGWHDMLRAYAKQFDGRCCAAYLRASHAGQCCDPIGAELYGVYGYKGRW